MKERPILFNAAMVRAILEGRKNQTRRVVNTRYIKQDDFGRDLIPKFPEITNPFGQPGDRLWVRETWQGPLLSTAGDYQKTNRGESINNPEHCVYRATDLLDAVDDDGKELGWRPSIHMPRWASRINLEITSVRIERLNDISEEDAISEGVQWAACGAPQEGSYKAGYAQLWEQISGPGSWEANPWVWAIEFRRAA